MNRIRREWVALTALGATAVIVWWAVSSVADEAGPSAEVAAAAESVPLHDDERVVTEEARRDAIARARVWRSRPVPIEQAEFLPDPRAPKQLSCRFKVADLGGTTPKFDCVLDSGEEVRIKYGGGPEIPGEAAATQLLRALGFGADDITLVPRLRCYGCPREPFSTMKAVEITRSDRLYQQVVDYSTYQDFEWVALERKLDARPIETEQQEGWAFFELDQVDPSRGGAPRAHVDALRLVAVLLAHWDNKSQNQRLVCLSNPWPANTPCQRPLLMLQDVGATFGPRKVDYEKWKEAPIWDDRATCTVSMRQLPYEGATFNEVRVSEAGRQFAGELLSALSERQLGHLFSAARFDRPRGLFGKPYPVADWVRTFQDKVRAITDGPTCPAA